MRKRRKLIWIAGWLGLFLGLSFPHADAWDGNSCESSLNSASKSLGSEQPTLSALDVLKWDFHDLSTLWFQNPPSEKQAVALFELSEKDESVRTHLAQEIARDSKLTQVAKAGLGLLEKAQLRLDETFPERKMDWIVRPYAELWASYNQFTSRRRVLREGTMSHERARMHARSDTDRMYPAGSGASPFETERYFQKKLFTYELTEEATLREPETMDLREIREWLQNRLDWVRELQLRNIRAAAKLLFETPGGEVALHWEQYVLEDSHEGAISYLRSFHQLIDETRFPPEEIQWRKSAQSAKEREEESFMPAFGVTFAIHSGFKDAGKRARYFFSKSSRRFQGMMPGTRNFLVRSVEEPVLAFRDQEKRIEFPFSINELFHALENRTNFWKFDQDPALRSFRGLAILHVAIEHRLIALEYKLKLQLEKFGKNLSAYDLRTARAQLESTLESFAEDPTQLRPSYFDAILSQFLSRDRAFDQDPATGMKWWGLSFGRAYWENRDSLASPNTPIRNRLKDFVSRTPDVVYRPVDFSYRFTKGVCQLGAVLGMVLAGVKGCDVSVDAAKVAFGHESSPVVQMKKMNLALDPNETSRTIPSETPARNDSNSDEKYSDLPGYRVRVRGKLVSQKRLSYLDLRTYTQAIHASRENVEIKSGSEFRTHFSPFDDENYYGSRLNGASEIELQTKAPLRPVSEILPFPVPSGLKVNLVDLEVGTTEGEILKGNEFQVERDRANGLMSIRLKGRGALGGILWDADRYWIRAKFFSEGDTDAPSEFRMNPERFDSAVNLLEEAGFEVLADHLRKAPRLPNEAPSLEAIDRAFVSSAVYSHDPENEDPYPEALASNPFVASRRFLHEGVCRYECDGANELETLFLRTVFQDQPDIVVEALVSEVLEGSSESSDWVGFTLPVGHQRTLVRSKDGSKKRILDATPLSEEVQRRKVERRSKDPGSIVPPVASKRHSSDSSNPIDGLPMEGPPRIPIVSEGDPVRAFAESLKRKSEPPPTQEKPKPVPEPEAKEPAAVDLYEIERSEHQRNLEQLETLQRKIKTLVGFEEMVRARRGGEIPLPHRVYLISVALLDYGRGRIDALAFQQKMLQWEPRFSQSDLSDPQILAQQLLMLQIQTRGTWDRAKKIEADRAELKFTWVEDGDLEKNIFELLHFICNKKWWGPDALKKYYEK